MDWVRRKLARTSTESKIPNHQSQSNPKGADEEQIYGITEELINFVKSFTIDTFKDFPLQDEDEATYVGETPTTSTKIQKDLSQWQERHAILLLSKVKETSQLRYALCPRHLKEKQFWRIYFKLVRSHLIEYELRAVQLEKLKSMAMEDEKSSDNGAWEVEMAEAKHGVFNEPQPS
ncbi:hypothetical protein L6164_000442 [Bauhinia variegata]|uniref:Uncharacterized protein n=1 Tax=Bauhinia variegata TaxID=167791 RepID=A0ACB9Q6S4_BAUVA|nr:hypothetical protein L6164_000442 [Bauhinia variegata]